MQTARRIASGVFAGWCRLALSFATQLLLVPIYLRVWDSETLGIWFALQAIVSMLQLFDIAHQTYLDGEFLKLGSTDKLGMQKVFADSVAFAVSLGVIQLVVVVTLSLTGILPRLAGIEASDAASHFASNVFLIGYAIIWTLFGTLGGIAVRALTALGYYARLTWWGVAVVGASLVATIPTVLIAKSLLSVVIAYLVSSFIVYALLARELRQLFKRESLHWVKPDYKAGFVRFLRSLVLVVQNFSEVIRQQGIRLVISPLAGAPAVAAFTTTRTGANVALQGLSTITAPLLPELMRYARQRDNDRLQGTLAMTWMVVIALMSPAIFLIQLLAGPLFEIWTRGKVAFDPLLFAIFSIGVLVYAIAQPASALVRANNLLRSQLILSLITGLLTLAATFALVSYWSLRGAGIGLLVGEITSATGYVWVANKWLSQNELCWPWKSFFVVIANTLIVTVGLCFAGTMSQFRTEAIFGCGTMMIVSAIAFFYSLPQLIRTRLVQIADHSVISRFCFR